MRKDYSVLEQLQRNIRKDFRRLNFMASIKRDNVKIYTKETREGSPEKWREA